MNFRTFISKEEVQSLDLIRFEGDIYVIETKEELEKALSNLSQEEYVGFDTETKPSFTKGEYYDPALIQLSTLTQCYLIRLKKTGFTNDLVAFFENKRIKKIGISIRDDIRDLQKVRLFEPLGFLDLNHVAERMSITQIGVRSLTGIFLNRRVSKSQQTSNWENAQLTESQKNYAATDSWICMKILEILQERGYL
ncbi:3'-5' exonuclease [Marinoscillum sp. MHG1-6]|uniref:3'-5' exonuclease n=1 Tax=Marinoscillum sp. MHG1-6 TaxID=2959627 RepID=UPI002158A0D8|nr:3'-5' exonuclease [Marinoscillum sp. MHG1-6]